MDDVIVRPRYSRHSMSGRRRRYTSRASKETLSMRGKITLQVIICTMTLALILLIKSINTPVTNYLSEKIEVGLSHNIELNTLYEGADNLISRLLGGEGISNGAEDTDKDYTNSNKDDPVSPENTQTTTGQAEEPINSTGVTDYDISVETDQELISAIKGKYGLMVPLEGYLSSAFGYMSGPVSKLHTGIDIGAEKGAEVRASAGGEIVESGTARSYGNYIKIKHGDDLETLYAHCSQLLARKGMKVEQGEIIARVGDTGVSTGAHLHFELLYKGKPINPIDFIKVPLK